MAILSVTRLKLRSVRHLPRFWRENGKAIAQVCRSEGFILGHGLAEISGAMWTMSLWESREAMRGYYLRHEHKAVMALLSDLACESCVADVDYDASSLPDWTTAHRILSESGRFGRALVAPSNDHRHGRIAPAVFRLFQRPFRPVLRTSRQPGTATA